MSDRTIEHGTPPAGPASYLERLTRALPGARGRSGNKGNEIWPQGAKLVISVSLHLEAGDPAGHVAGTSHHETPGPFADRQEYAIREGIPRLLEVFGRRRVRTTCHMPAAAADRNPALAKEIVERGHEAAASGQARTGQLSLGLEPERAACERVVQSIVRATGTHPVGFDGQFLNRSSDSVALLQELGFLYHTNDASRDEPFLVVSRGKPFVVVPSSPEISDRLAFEARFFSSETYAVELKNEFEMLYSEAESRRRLMCVSAHGGIAGRPARAKVLEEFIIHAQRRPGVVFMRKDEIARFALASSLTPREAEPLQQVDAA